MSGRRHHFIPQFLQRGFASHSSGKDFYTWVYRKGDINPFNSNIRNIGMEGDFYSEDKETVLDDKITDVEYEFGIFVNELRKAEFSTKVDKSKAAKLIAHLEVRTKNIRINFRNAGTHLINEMINFLEDTANCERFVRNQVKTQVKEMIDEELKKRNVPRNLLPIARIKLAPLIEQQIPEMIKHIGLMMKYMREHIHELFDNSAKSGHIKALTNSHTPPIKVSVYEKLNYEIISTGDIKIPLGDSGVIFNIDGEQKFKPFYEKGAKLHAVILPISTTRILIGSIKGYSININELPSAIAACSLEYFITNEESIENDNLSKIIAKNTAILTTSEIDEILSDLLPKN